jgi:hypothetical protein
MAATKTTTRTPTDVHENSPGNGAEAAAGAPGTDTRPAPDRIGGAVWSVLSDHPGTTAATLATEAGVGMAAARRALNDLEKAGYAARTPGGRTHGKRTADTWHATAADTTTTHAIEVDATQGAPVAPDETPTTPPDQPSDEAPDTTADAAPGDQTDAVDPADVADRPTGDEQDAPDGDGDQSAEAMDEVALAQAREALSALTTVINSASAALDTGDRAAALEAAEAIYGDSAKMRRLIKTAIKPRPRNGSGNPHAHPGELRVKVAAHLMAHPGLQLTPHEIGKAIGHSAGAVANALDKLTESGQAVLTCDRPRRFTATVSDAAVGSPHAENTAATA